MILVAKTDGVLIMKKLLFATAIASFALATAARAGTVSSRLGVIPPAGETLVPFPVGSNLVTGDLSDVYRAPTLAGGASVTAPYLAVEPGGPVTITFRRKRLLRSMWARWTPITVSRSAMGSLERSEYCVADGPPLRRFGEQGRKRAVDVYLQLHGH